MKWGVHMNHVETGAADAVKRKPYSRPKLSKMGQLARLTAAVPAPISPAVKPSDVRLKEDIRQIGVTKHGLPFYRFRYRGEVGVYEGVMAQDVLGVKPEAVLISDDGYLRVNYVKLCVPFRQVH
jgi:hypothetical protein